MEHAKMLKANQQLMTMWELLAAEYGGWSASYPRFTEVREAFLANEGIDLNDYFDWVGEVEGL